MMRYTAFAAAVIIAIGACGFQEPDYGKTDSIAFAQANLSLKSSTGLNVLRVGQALALESLDVSDAVMPNTKYSVRVRQGANTLFEGSLLTNLQGRFETTTLAHDVGEFGDGLKEGTSVAVELDDGTQVLRGTISLGARAVAAGWAIDEVDTPHVYTSTPDGTPNNAFVVGGKAEGEVTGPIYVAGDHFPADTTVDVYVVKDRDEWKNARFPRSATEGLIAGPVSVTTDRQGNLPATSTGFAPAGSQHLGPYDIVVDVDRNGTFDWELTVKDAADGENKVGFTVQYSRQWLEQFASRQLVVNLAYDSKSRNAGTYANNYGTLKPTVFGYVNPPVFNHRNDYHKKGIFVLIEHKSWTQYWNNPDPSLDAGCSGCRDISPFIVNTGGGGGDFGVPLQPGCMNAPPVALFNATSGAVNQQGQPVKQFDVVFLANRKNTHELIYKPGHDLLDLNLLNSTSGLQDPTQLDDSKAKGFTVD